MKCRECGANLVITDHLAQGLCRQCVLEARLAKLGEVQEEARAETPVATIA